MLTLTTKAIAKLGSLSLTKLAIPRANLKLLILILLTKEQLVLKEFPLSYNFITSLKELKVKIKINITLKLTILSTYLNNKKNNPNLNI